MPAALDRREHLPRQRAGHPRPHRLEPHQPRGRPSCCDRVGLRENPVTPVRRHRRRQAAARRDRQGAVQGGQAADPRRADRGAQRRRLRPPARPAARPARRGHHLRDHLAQAQRDRRRSPTRITILRDGRTIETLRHAPTTASPRTASSPAWSAATSSTASRRTSRTSARRCCASRTGPCTAPPSPAGSSSPAPTSTLRRGEIVGLAGLMGAGRTELAMSVFGRSYGISISGRIVKDGQEIQVRTVRRRDPARHRVRHRGPQAVRPQPDRGHQAQRLRRRAGQAGPARLGRRQRGVPGRRGLPARA